MKHKYGILATILTMILCMGLFVGCGTDGSTDADDDYSYSYDEEESTDELDDTVTIETEDVIGKVTYVSDSYITVDTYTAEAEVEDYATFDTSTLSADGLTEYVYLEDDTEVYYVSYETLYGTTQDELEVGNMIAVTEDEEGIQQVIILEYAEEDTTTEDNTSDEY